MKYSFASGAILMFIVNATLLIFLAARSHQDNHFDKITVKEFELAGDDGVRRATIKVESSGEVVFRLMDKKGTIRVKLGASEDGSGLVLLNEDTEPGIHVLSKKSGRITVREKSGKQRGL